MTKSSSKGSSPPAAASPRTASPRAASTTPEHTTEAIQAVLESEIPLEADEAEQEEVIDDGDSAFGSAHSSTTSLRDDLIQQLREHGRQYKGYLEAKYVLPMDEMGGIVTKLTHWADFQCHLVWLTLERQHTLAPIKNPGRILDAGCGTGMWTIAFADDYPGTEVVGVDLAPVQPDCVPPNLQFEIDDLEQPWTFSRKFDYIHSQLMIGAFSDWPKFCQQSYEFLEPGGYLEVHDIDFVIQCDDDTLAADSALVRWHEQMHDGAAKAGFPLDAVSKVPDMMRAAGFDDVTAIPIKWPINTWPRDARHKELGRWAMENFCWGCESMSLAIFTRVLGWSVEELRVLMSQVRAELRNRKIHAYWNFYVIYGRKKD